MPSTSYLCVTLLSNLIYLAFRELVSLRVGCVTMWSRGLHQIWQWLSSNLSIIFSSQACFAKRKLSLILMIFLIIYKKECVLFNLKWIRWKKKVWAYPWTPLYELMIEDLEDLQSSSESKDKIRDRWSICFLKRKNIKDMGILWWHGYA